MRRRMRDVWVLVRKLLISISIVESKYNQNRNRNRNRKKRESEKEERMEIFFPLKIFFQFNSIQFNSINKF